MPCSRHVLARSVSSPSESMAPVGLPGELMISPLIGFEGFARACSSTAFVSSAAVTL